ncbi:hypothetical protein [Caballeronia arvi]|uniref:hypothetical protein n=1 Tax=Caballeronia arvi TaxID=1777135 RepID=UPI001F3416D4|nr:hypothetical protein [Caballeronia arvi]
MARTRFSVGQVVDDIVGMSNDARLPNHMDGLLRHFNREISLLACKTGFDEAAGATTSALLRLLTMKPRPVAVSGIRALLQGKAMLVAGLSNKMAGFSNRCRLEWSKRGALGRQPGPPRRHGGGVR